MEVPRLRVVPFWKTAEYNECLREFAADATKHGFRYQQHVHLLAALARDMGIVRHPLLVCDPRGWAICTTHGDTKHIEINFVFVKPSYRRRGWFRSLVRTVLSPMNGGRGIFVACCARTSPEMFKSVVSLEFKLWDERRSNGNDLLFLWQDPEAGASGPTTRTFLDEIEERMKQGLSFAVPDGDPEEEDTTAKAAAAAAPSPMGEDQLQSVLDDLYGGETTAVPPPQG
jgi:hypothetical protein